MGCTAVRQDCYECYGTIAGSVTGVQGECYRQYYGNAMGKATGMLRDYRWECYGSAAGVLRDRFWSVTGVLREHALDSPAIQNKGEHA